MKVPMRWLKEYTEIPLSAADYAEKMIMAGNGVEGIENTGDLFDHVVVGHVLSCEDIPETHLHLCMVEWAAKSRSRSSAARPMWRRASMSARRWTARICPAA